jgi:hypothetical protein
MGLFFTFAGGGGPHNLGKEFKSEEMGEKWLDVSESDTAIDMMIRKHRK